MEIIAVGVIFAIALVLAVAAIATQPKVNHFTEKPPGDWGRPGG